jgi:hypothetical protein
MSTRGEGKKLTLKVLFRKSEQVGGFLCNSVLAVFKYSLFAFPPLDYAVVKLVSVEEIIDSDNCPKNDRNSHHNMQNHPSP